MVRFWRWLKATVASMFATNHEWYHGDRFPVKFGDKLMTGVSGSLVGGEGEGVQGEVKRIPVTLRMQLVKGSPGHFRVIVPAQTRAMLKKRFGDAVAATMVGRMTFTVLLDSRTQTIYKNNTAVLRSNAKSRARGVINRHYPRFDVTFREDQSREARK